MNKKKQTTELQESYHAMVNSIEEFMVKEGKTLQQAFHAAEEKLSKAKEISKEKVQQASRDLKDNLRLLGETVEGVSEAYKERIKFDVAYVNNSIWDKLQGIAYSNAAELIEFTRTLKENAQTVITEEHLVAHQQHNQWASDHALWLYELEFWQKEHGQALTKLAEVEKELKQQSTLLLEHAQVIKAHAEIDHEHERIMANEEQDPSSEVFKVADEKEVALHQKEQRIHAQHSELQSALKTHHFKMMAMINMLYREIHKAQ